MLDRSTAFGYLTIVINRADPLLPLVTVLVCTAVTAMVAGAQFYIGPSGSDRAAGTELDPWGTFDFAIGELNAGDKLFVGGGIYDLNKRILIQQGGTNGNPINIWAVAGQTPILDFDGMTDSWGKSSGRGIQIDDGADWLHIKGLTIQNARDNGIWSGANNGVFEQTVTRWNGDSGLQLSGFAANNLILNADSYENYDPSGNGENADGFAIKFSDLGPGNVVRGARAWGNSDDGWDMWQSVQGGGSLPISDFLRLVNGSTLIDAGTNVGSTFEGLAPDLGAFEFVPTEKPGDFDQNGTFDTSDIDELVAQIATGGNAPMFDVNMDSVVDTLDIQEWLSLAATENGFASPFLPGDANLNGTVDVADLNAFGLNWQDNTALWSAGDFTSDGSIDAADLNVLAIRWEQSIAAVIAVPEPTKLLLWFFVGMTVFSRGSLRRTFDITATAPHISVGVKANS